MLCTDREKCKELNQEKTYPFENALRIIVSVIISSTFRATLASNKMFTHSIGRLF